MPFTEQFSIFFTNADFATAATYNAATVQVIFDNDFVDASGMTASTPGILGETSDFSSAAKGDTITISGTVYVMKQIEHDGTGVTLIRLVEQ